MSCPDGAHRCEKKHSIKFKKCILSTIQLSLTNVHVLNEGGGGEIQLVDVSRISFLVNSFEKKKKLKSNKFSINLRASLNLLDKI